MLRLEGIHHRFGSYHALNAVDLTLDKGGFIGVIGRSGAGKSTLLRSINRLITPSEGRILWNGEDITALKGAALHDWRRRCAMVFQQFNLVGRLDVLTNVLVGRINRAPSWRAMLNMWSEEDMLLALSALEQFDMGAYAARRADSLSGGQQQRVAIARAFVQEPEIILADEPIASLDPRNTKMVMDALQRINRHFGITVLCNLHSLDLAKSYCDRLIGMAAGQVVFNGSPDELTEDVARTLYGLDAHEVLDAAPLPSPDALPGAVIAA